MTNVLHKNFEESISEEELTNLIEKYDFLSLSDDQEYVLVKTRNPNKKQLKIHKDNIRLRGIINKQIPVIGRKAISKEQQELDKVKNHLKRLLKNKEEEYKNREKLINSGIDLLNKADLDSKELKKIIKQLKQSIDSLLKKKSK